MKLRSCTRARNNYIYMACLLQSQKVMVYYSYREESEIHRGRAHIYSETLEHTDCILNTYAYKASIRM